jgi:hypothetical protein
MMQENLNVKQPLDEAVGNGPVFVQRLRNNGENSKDKDKCYLPQKCCWQH